MGVIIKTPEEISILREGGHRLARVLEAVSKMVKPGISTAELDAYSEKLIRDGGDEPAFLNYRPAGARMAFPATLCVSVNNEVVHGIPSDKKILKEGDIVSLDCGLKHKGLFTDHAITVPVGKANKEARKLIEVTKESLYVGIVAAKGGAKTGDIGYAIQSYVKPFKYGIVRILSGHGVGKAIHEDPYIPNFGKKGSGVVLKPGMVVAIEPMLNMGTDDVILLGDGYTYKTRDGALSAHFEHTILITEGEPEILTKVD